MLTDFSAVSPDVASTEKGKKVGFRAAHGSVREKIRQRELIFRVL